MPVLSAQGRSNEQPRMQRSGNPAIDWTESIGKIILDRVLRPRVPLRSTRGYPLLRPPDEGAALFRVCGRLGVYPYRCMRFRVAFVALLCLGAAFAQEGPDPREIPIPAIETPVRGLPGVDELPVRDAMPDVMTMNDGTRVQTREQWLERREELKKILEYYAVGQAPPAPGNVRGEQLEQETVLEGRAKYRLVRLTFGPERKLSLHIGVFTPAEGGPFPAVILQSGTPPGAPELPRMPWGPNQGRGEDVLMLVGPKPKPGDGPPSRGRPASR